MSAAGMRTPTWVLRLQLLLSLQLLLLLRTGVSARRQLFTAALRAGTTRSDVAAEEADRAERRQASRRKWRAGNSPLSSELRTLPCTFERRDAVRKFRCLFNV
eukprot:SAG11_NODE_464_length_9216_cov_131.568326_11_plen_103_part_00